MENNIEKANRMRLVWKTFPALIDAMGILAVLGIVMIATVGALFAGMYYYGMINKNLGS